MKTSIFISLLALAGAVFSPFDARAESSKGEPQRENLKIKAGYIDNKGNSFLIFDSTPATGAKAIPGFLRKNPVVYCTSGHCSQMNRKAEFGDSKSGLIYDVTDADGRKVRLETLPKKGEYDFSCADGERHSLKPLTFAQSKALEEKIHKGELNIRSLPFDVRQIEYAFGNGVQNVYITSQKFDGDERSFKAFIENPPRTDEVRIRSIERSGRDGIIRDFLLMNGQTLHVGLGPHGAKADLSGVPMKEIRAPVDNKTVLPKIPGPISDWDSSPCVADPDPSEHRSHTKNSHAMSAN